MTNKRKSQSDTDDRWQEAVDKAAQKAALTVVRSGRVTKDGSEAAAIAMTTLAKTVATTLYVLLSKNPDAVRHCLESIFCELVLEIVDEWHEDLTKPD